MARDNLATARARQKYYADLKRRDISFEEEELIMLRSDSLNRLNRSDLPSKWRTKFVGPFTVLDVLGQVTYRVELPPSMGRAHNVIYVSKLKTYNRRKGQDRPLKIIIDADGTVGQAVEKILDKKTERR